MDNRCNIKNIIGVALGTKNFDTKESRRIVLVRYGLSISFKNVKKTSSMDIALELVFNA